MNAVLKPRTNFTGIQAEDVLSVWKNVKPFLDRVMPYGNHEQEPEHIRASLVSRDMQLWVGTEGMKITHVVITQIVTYPTGKRICEFTHCSGENMKDWLEHTVDYVGEWALANGCDELAIIGRKGWAKVLPDFKALYTVYNKRL